MSTEAVEVVLYPHKEKMKSVSVVMVLCTSRLMVTQICESVRVPNCNIMNCIIY